MDRPREQKKIERFLELQYDRAKLEKKLHLVDEEGSNAWAFAPSRTVSGKAILLRNPHLSWDAGYSEAHITVPGIINFYGDFRVGRSLFYNGGFNEYLGWSTTNNYPDLDEIYAWEFDPDDFPANFPEPRLGLRSQLALELVDNDHKLTLEEVVDLKHSMRMLLADRIKRELIVAVRSSNPEPELSRPLR